MHRPGNKVSGEVAGSLWQGLFGLVTLARAGMLEGASSACSGAGGGVGRRRLDLLRSNKE